MLEIYIFSLTLIQVDVLNYIVVLNLKVRWFYSINGPDLCLFRNNKFLRIFNFHQNSITYKIESFKSIIFFVRLINA